MSLPDGVAELLGTLEEVNPTVRARRTAPSPAAPERARPAA